MNNIWTDRKAKNRYYSMPVTLNEDRELEYEHVKGSQIPKLIEFWTWHANHGSISVSEHRAIVAIILCQFETM
jgi:hypothetical protein